MNIERLKELVDYLKTVNEDNFDMEYYARNENYLDSPRKTIINHYNECGTVACVAGHAAMLNINDFKSKDYNISYWFNNFYDIDDIYLDLWITSSIWLNYDNTLKGAIRRINYAIINPNNIPFVGNDINKAILIYNKPKYDNYV